MTHPRQATSLAWLTVVTLALVAFPAVLAGQTVPTDAPKVTFTKDPPRQTCVREAMAVPFPTLRNYGRIGLRRALLVVRM